jgi:AcrR family transcriptional regulator
MGIKQRVTGSDVVQKRAIETREKIIISALEMYTKKGYNKTTVDEIAANAEVSVGVAYRYFKNKKALLLSALEYCFENITVISGTSPADLIDKNLDKALKAFEKLHTDYRDLHEELEGLRHTDEDVRNLYDGFTKKAIREIYDSFPKKLKEKPHSMENLYIAIGIMEDYCHHYMNKDLSREELKYMRQRTVELTGYLLLGDEMK